MSETNVVAVDAFARHCLRRERPFAVAVNSDGDVLVSDRNVVVGVYGGETALLPGKAKRPSRYAYCFGERAAPDLWAGFAAWRDTAEGVTPLTPTGLLMSTDTGVARLFATGDPRDAATRFVRVDRRYLRLLPRYWEQARVSLSIFTFDLLPGGQVRCWDGKALVLVAMPLTMDRAERGRVRFTLDEVLAGHVLPGGGSGDAAATEAVHERGAGRA